MVVAFDVAGPYPQLYLSSSWSLGVPDTHREYVADLVQQLAAGSPEESQDFMRSIQDLSVGPLRFDVDGTCDETGLSKLLRDLFGDSGYRPFPAIQSGTNRSRRGSGAFG
jgi:hypothetical protein